MGVWTCATEFVFGWALYPLQSLPALGHVSLAQLPSLLRDGALCTIGAGAGCNAVRLSPRASRPLCK